MCAVLEYVIDYVVCIVHSNMSSTTSSMDVHRLFEYIWDRLRHRRICIVHSKMWLTTLIDKYATFAWICDRLRYRRICNVHNNMWSTTSSTDMRRLLEDVTDYAIDKYMPLLDYVIEGYMHFCSNMCHWLINAVTKLQSYISKFKFYFWNLDTSINKHLCFGLKFLAILNYSKFENEQRKLLNGGGVT